MSNLLFSNINLMHNPFGELEPEQRADVAIVDAGVLCRHLSQSRSAVQFVGPCGRGKSTHLHVLRQEIQASSYTYCAEGESALMPELTGELVIVDEVQRMSWRQRRKLFKSDVPIAIGTHVDYSAALQRAGRQLLSIEVEQLLTEEHLHRCLNRRIEYARRSVGRIPTVTEATTASLHRRYGTDLRSIESELYEVFQSLSEPIDV